MIESGYFFNPIRRELEMIKGDTMSFGFQVQGLNGEVPSAVQFSCKEALEDENYLFAVSLEDTIDIRSYDQETDTLTYSVRIPPAKTSEVDAGRYFYDLELKCNADTITLMIGRLTIDDQVTTVAGEPYYPSGDSDIYPMADIPEGTKKVYTTQNVSNIAASIEAINGETGGYTLFAMAGAVDDIGGAIDDINEAVKEKTGSASDYNIFELAEAVESIPTYEDINDTTFPILT